MPKFFIQKNQIKNDQIIIIGNDVNHIKNVLRAKKGEKLEICNIDEAITYYCEIQQIEEKEITCKKIEVKRENVEPKTKVTIFQGLPKADKMELIIQKAVELGAYDIVPVEMKRCVVKLKDKDKIKKIERWQKQSESAAKQSGRNIIPKIKQILKIEEVCKEIKKYDIAIIAYEKENKTKLKEVIEKIKETKKEEIKIGIVIGPEGGFEEEEIEQLKKANGKIVTLGERILRTETVALQMLSIIMYEFDK